MESLRREKSTVAMQKTGVLIVEEIRRKRDGNQKKIQELIDFLRQESEAANSKVWFIIIFIATYFTQCNFRNLLWRMM